MTESVRIETGGGPLRPWQWELVERGAGPDHVAVLQFDKNSTERLERAVQEVDLPGFQPHRYEGRGGAPCLTYIDDLHSTKFAGMLRGEGGNLYAFCAIQVCADALELRNGYGAGGADEVGAQTRLLHHLLTGTPGLNLVEWRILGDESGVVASGATSAKLLAYLRGQGDAPQSSSDSDSRAGS